MIELRDLHFSRPNSVFRLEIPALTIAKGQATAIIGPSGCGKTTLLHLIAGIIPSQQGSIQVAEQQVSGLNDTESRRFRSEHIGFVFQDFALLEYLTLFDNILHPYRTQAGRRVTKAVRQKAQELAEHVGIAGRLRAYPKLTSQGEQQRTAICRALLHSPSVLLADEPTGNLDPSNKHVMLELLLDYVRTNQATLLVATHDHDLLDAFDQVIDFTTFT